MNKNISKKITIILIAYKSEKLINDFVKKIPNSINKNTFSDNFKKIISFFYR